MSYLIYLLGFLPSIVWLLFYLRKDSRPEPNRMILKIFFFGIIAALFAIFLEKGFQALISFFQEQRTLKTILAVFLGGALIEESVKYLVVRIGVFRNSELDEPVDLILYMIISALGFAALENIMVLSSIHPILTTAKALETMAWRFVSATFLHALCSGLIGWFLIMAFCHLKQKRWLIVLGLFLATLLHGLYNFSIIKIDGLEKFILPGIILIGLALSISLSFKKVKQLKSTCKL